MLLCRPAAARKIPRSASRAVQPAAAASRAVEAARAVVAAAAAPKYAYAPVSQPSIRCRRDLTRDSHTVQLRPGGPHLRRVPEPQS